MTSTTPAAEKAKLSSRFRFCRSIRMGRLRRTSSNWWAFSSRKQVLPVRSATPRRISSPSSRKRRKPHPPCQHPERELRKLLALGSFANLLTPQCCTRLSSGWIAPCHHNAARNVIATSYEVAMTPLRLALLLQLAGELTEF